MSYELNATLRNEQGTGASRRLRREGKLPAVVYGNEKEAQVIVLDHNEIYYALQREDFHSSIIKLSVDGKVDEVLVRDFQMHPFKPAVQHIDFQRVNKKEIIKANVPLHFVNAEISPAVKLHGGRISRLINSIEVFALPDNIPTSLEVDLSKIVGGQIVHISDINFPKGVESVALKRGGDLAIVAASGKNRTAE
ncbi:50S ribosomal protein L25/general stress protein Ctc [Neisseria sp. Ec49-e6-T10]|uniref:50S ribosomal protein L25/general stress protein Ctc n=1 Tax=Neisseria sp. Ec49-e6-T10 TaxID=3140744 RepID=UPI003EB8CC8C